jgi:hypothetical protein
MYRLLITLAVFGLVSATSLSSQATPRNRTRVEYIVTEYNPMTGGKVSTNRYYDRTSADRQYDSLSKAHWVKWRFVGINEPLRFRRFRSSYEAQNFINNDGPSKSGKLGFAILTNQTRIVPTKVTLTTVNVPVNGGGPGNGGNVDAGQVVGVIDKIIGIIGN